MVDTMKAGNDLSSGFVSRRTLKEREGPAEPMLEQGKRCLTSCGKLVVEVVFFDEKRRERNLGSWGNFSAFMALWAWPEFDSGQAN